MSTGRGEAKRAERRAEEASRQARQEREQLQAKTRKEKLKSQQLFMRQVLARQRGGFFSSGQSDKLG